MHTAPMETPMRIPSERRFLAIPFSALVSTSAGVEGREAEGVVTEGSVAVVVSTVCAVVVVVAVAVVIVVVTAVVVAAGILVTL